MPKLGGPGEGGIDEAEVEGGECRGRAAADQGECWAECQGEQAKLASVPSIAVQRIRDNAHAAFVKMTLQKGASIND